MCYQELQQNSTTTTELNLRYRRAGTRKLLSIGTETFTTKGVTRHSRPTLSKEGIGNATGGTDNHVCPPWLTLTNGTCTCGSKLNGKIRCEQNLSQAYLLNCNCMTYDPATTKAVVGACLYNCFQKSSYTSEDSLYHKLPPSVSKLNEEICGPLHRSGQLCGNCEDGYVMPSYSYRLDCVKCSYSRWNWVKYILVAFLPLTVFFVVVVTCRLSAASKELNAFVIVVQVMSAPGNARVILLAVQYSNDIRKKSTQSLLTLYGIWNLDFCRDIIPPLCLNASFLLGLSLDYAISFYPLVLIFATYILIKMYEHCIKPIVWLWKTFAQCFVRLRRQWDIKTSIIEAFSTFLILSYVKSLSVAFSILAPTQVFDIHGHSRLYLYHNASIEFFGEEHLPYAIVAVFVLLVFNVLPLLLLLLYPLRCFQRCLNRCRLRSLALTTFMDAFQGHYKDGTNGTRDCRYFASMYFVAQLLGYAISICTLSALYWAMTGLLLAAVSITIIVFQPYKSQIQNAISATLLLSFAMFCISLICADIGSYSRNTTFTSFSSVLACILAVVPLMYITGLVLYWVVLHKRLPQRSLQWIRRHSSNSTHDTDRSTSLLPDRLCNPQCYIAVLPEVVNGADSDSDSTVKNLPLER